MSGTAVFDWAVFDECIFDYLENYVQNGITLTCTIHESIGLTCTIHDSITLGG